MIDCKQDIADKIINVWQKTIERNNILMFNRKINILITGAKGQLGSYLVDYFKKKSFLKSSKIGKVFGIDKDDLDISKANCVSDFFNKNVIDPPIDIDYVIHCAAATDTTAIEKNPLDYYSINCLGAMNIARSCAYNKIKMVFISTDYIFSELSPIVGIKHQPFPVNQYGLQKLIAEQFVKEAYSRRPNYLIIFRSSWMYGNSKNSFVEKFLKNVLTAYAKNEKNVDGKIEVNVVDDAYGKPTPVWEIANWLHEEIILEKKHGTFNYGEDFSFVTRYDWAKIILNAAYSVFVPPYVETDIFEKIKDTIQLVPISSDELNLPMKHPRKLQTLAETSSSWKIDKTIEHLKREMRFYLRQNCDRIMQMAMEIVKK